MFVCPFFALITICPLNIHQKTNKVESDRRRRRGKQFKILLLLPMWLAMIDIEECKKKFPEKRRDIAKNDRSNLSILGSPSEVPEGIYGIT